MAQVHIRGLDDEPYDKLKARAAAEDIPVAEVCRRALTVYADITDVLTSVDKLMTSCGIPMWTRTKVLNQLLYGTPEAPSSRPMAAGAYAPTPR
jgi:hypothetical protein